MPAPKGRKWLRVRGELFLSAGKPGPRTWQFAPNGPPPAFCAAARAKYSPAMARMRGRPELRKTYAGFALSRAVRPESVLPTNNHFAAIPPSPQERTIDAVLASS